MKPIRASHKLHKLAEIEGFSNPQELMESIEDESIVPGICINPNCTYTTSVEPDCRDAWCEECNSKSVWSAIELIFAGNSAFI